MAMSNINVTTKRIVWKKRTIQYDGKVYGYSYESVNFGTKSKWDSTRQPRFRIEVNNRGQAHLNDYATGSGSWFKSLTVAKLYAEGWLNCDIDDDYHGTPKRKQKAAKFGYATFDAESNHWPPALV